MKRLILILFLLSMTFALSSCAKLKPWERETLALEPMQVETIDLGVFDRNMEVYREGAVGGNGGKSGGGCGCS